MRPPKSPDESQSSFFGLHCVYILCFLMASCILLLGTYYGLRNGKFLKLISKPIPIALLIICLKYEKYLYIFLKGLQFWVFNCHFTFKRRCDNFALQLSVQIFTTVLVYSLYEIQCCHFSVQFSPHSISGRRTAVAFIHTKDVIFLTFQWLRSM